MDTNLRTMKVEASRAVDVKNTQMLEPGAHKTSAEKSQNVTTQYETRQSVGTGPLGAQNSGS